MDGSFKELGIILTVTFTAIGGLLYCAEKDIENWDNFKAAHSCVKVGEMRGDVFNTLGVGANGSAVIGLGSTPDKEGFKCDDGVTYWR